MKTDNTGCTLFYRPHRESSLASDPHLCYRLQNVLLDYRANRENGNNADLPFTPFPGNGFETLKITEARAQDWNSRWPDEDGRYWFQLTLKDNSVINEFYWKEDRIRGYPDPENEERYWFSLHHAPSGIAIEGFFQEYHQQKSLLDNDGNHWHSIQFTDKYCHPILDWMKEKDHRYLTRVFLENSVIENYEEIYALLNGTYREIDMVFSGCFLGIMTEYGLGIEKSAEIAAEYYQLGAVSGYPLAQVLLAANYMQKLSDNDTIKKAQDLLTKSLTPPDRYMHDYYYDLYTAILKFLLKVAANDCKSHSNLVLAIIYEQGLLGIKKNDNNRLYYCNAASSGNIWAQINLARRGIETPRTLIYSSDRPIITWQNVLNLVEATLDGNSGVLLVQNYPSEFSDDDKLSQLIHLIINKKSSELRVLDLSYNQLQDNLQNAIAYLVMHLPYLQKLILNSNLITQYGLKQLLSSLKEHKSLKELQLRNNRIDEQNKEFFSWNFIEPILSSQEDALPTHIRVDLSLNLMTPALSDKMLSESYKKLISALQNVLIALDRPLGEIRGVKLKTIRVNDRGEIQLGFTRKNENGEEIFDEKSLTKQGKKSLIEFKKAMCPENRSIEINEISDTLLGNCFFKELEKRPKKALINLKCETPAKQKKITKKLLQSHPETPLKYLLTYHPLFSHPGTRNDSEWPCLLMPEFSICEDRWLVYLMIRREDKHAFLAWEGLYKHGQRCFERAHLTAEVDNSNGLGLIKDEARWMIQGSGRPGIVTSSPPASKEGGLSKKPDWFEQARERYHIVPVYGTKQQVKRMLNTVRNEIIAKKPLYKHRIVVIQGSSGRSNLAEDLIVQNCITWARDKINHFLELPPEHQITGTGISDGNLYTPRTHEVVLQEFDQRKNMPSMPEIVSPAVTDGLIPSTLVAATGLSAGLGVSQLIRNHCINSINAALVAYTEQVDRQLLSPGPIINTAIHENFYSQISWPSFFQNHSTGFTIALGALGAVGAVGAFRLVSRPHSSYTNAEIINSNSQNDPSDSSEHGKANVPN